ncbi:MAG TPA: glycine/sarcosine/betaine reductase component B subunit, partial [Dehalococcoidia bacterium]|nr:glycine/sarcosine/betaine reductase component B subunit [Dehalococcoidia bacterium]
MRLTLAIHPVHSISMGGVTRLEGTRLTVDGDGLKQLILEDTRLRGVDIEVAASGEEYRIGVVSDIVEPRAKEPGSGFDFPGVVGPMAVAGMGTTHVLRGAAVTVLHEGALLQNGKVL